ncbi:MAG: hypothetical protein IMF26_02680 [Candidatus Fermentithermobacillus carboniphilus]|uniref:ABC-2 type transport system permease protein n=1 Tax=Candidatus Fermentithermobacillus carboniphilus TaxID=3085328 RepID=A0AAT9LD28_9FIRM|nr:MAG: hypothetical protein IMF26_02680 [Candidatus Fermentithermobacillus carboniphilus]
MSVQSLPGLRKSGRGRPFLSLVGTQLKIEYGGRGISEKLGLGETKRFSPYLYVIFIAIGFVPLLVMLFKLANALCTALVEAGQPGLTVIMALVLGQMFVFFMAISHLMSALYYSNDLETLLGLPLSPWQIMSAKIVVVYLGELIFALVTVMPFLIVLGPKVHVTEYWIYALLVFMLAPAVPIAISLLAVVILMRVTNRARKKDLFRVLFGLLFFVLILGFQYANANLAKYGPESAVSLLLERNGLVQLAAGYYPILKWSAWALTAETPLARAGGLFLYCGVSAGALVLMTSISQRWFLGGVGREVRSAANDRAGTRGEQKALTLLAKVHSPRLAVMLRDHRVLVRTPNHLLTALLNLTVIPLIMLFGYIGGGSELKPLLGMINDPRVVDILSLIVAGVNGLFVGLNQIASTAVSREGSLFRLSKVIPVPPEEQVRGKLWYCMCYALVQTAITVVAAWVVFGVDLLHLWLIAGLSALAAWPVSIIGLINDLYHPKLTWTDPQQAMKGNFQTMIAGLFAVLYLVLVGAVIRTLYIFGVKTVGLYCTAFGILLVSGYLLQGFLWDTAAKRYSEIEV